ncbi:polysaccharide deacetylase family protein [Pseudoalteromonas sp. P1-11]|uniref:polysaccharide deacetylase family protein n=1 Tax=Pseudoalteromonas sp. P1-11 TaxID=1715254 RepID=UPI0006DBE594|nr:polysaccharide deacetylase family protein [Pseudoalteromonas sp. P1-11]KPW01270.1 Polysaccharide deacetylase [Pseudoalteromonas sp. P1-11]
MKSLLIAILMAASFTCAASKAPLKSYPNGATKAVIFSYDDGVIQDRKLVELFNKYQVVGTFNLNSGLFAKKLPWMKAFTGKEGEYIKQSEVKTLYKGHEIASHSYSHPGFAGLDTAELKLQLARDKHILSPIKGNPLHSFAYPLGSYDKTAMKLVKQAGFTNARTVNDTLNFELPTNYTAWNPTAHHSKAMPLIEQYIALKSNKLTVMMIWGHSWEFDKNTVNNNWDYAEKLVQTISNKDDIWYVSAGEFIAFLENK